MARANQVIIDQLPNGLRLVHRLMPGATEFCGLTVNAGSRDELTIEEYGLAHFVEHTIFKGTSRRSDSYIRNRMETIGGELNAFTTKEETTIYSAMPAGNHKRACNLIAELACESIFPTKKLDLEREVICDEIDSYLDSPSEAIYDYFDEMAYANNSLAHNILGTKESVMSIDSSKCQRWLSSHFVSNNAVYFYLGPEPATKVFKTAATAFANMPQGSSPLNRIAPSQFEPENKIIDIASHQCHVLSGTHIGGLHSPTRHIVALATNIIGGAGMNSWLNLELRERRGLVYTVEASTALMSDCGLMTIYFGCDHSDLTQCTEIVKNTLDRLANKELTDKQLTSYKRQYLGQLTLGLDNKEQLAISTGRAILHGLQAPSFESTSDLIKSITPKDVRDVAEMLAQSSNRTLTLA